LFSKVEVDLSGPCNFTARVVVDDAYLMVAWNYMSCRQVVTRYECEFFNEYGPKWVEEGFLVGEGLSRIYEQRYILVDSFDTIKLCDVHDKVVVQSYPVVRDETHDCALVGAHLEYLVVVYYDDVFIYSRSSGDCVTRYRKSIDMMERICIHPNNPAIFATGAIMRWRSTVVNAVWLVETVNTVQRSDPSFSMIRALVRHMRGLWNSMIHARKL
jgi:hypothetical protein